MEVLNGVFKVKGQRNLFRNPLVDDDGHWRALDTRTILQIIESLILIGDPLVQFVLDLRRISKHNLKDCRFHISADRSSIEEVSGDATLSE